MLRKSTLILLLVSFCYGNKNTVFIDAGGAAFTGSVNYERIFTNPLPSHALGVRIGVGLAYSTTRIITNQATTTNVSYGLTIPIQCIYLMGPLKHKLELGAGYSVSCIFPTVENKHERMLATMFNGTIGYRFSPFKNALNFHVGFAPMFLHVLNSWRGADKLPKSAITSPLGKNIRFMPWAYIGCGYSW